MTVSKRPHLSRVVSTLEATARSNGATLPDVVAETGLPRSTAYRVLNELVEVGLISYSKHDHLYKLDTKLYRIAYGGLSQRNLETVVGPHLRKLAETADETAIFARLTGHDVSIVLIEMPSGNARAQVVPAIGRTPRYACSTSKAIMAFQPEEFALRVFSENSEVYPRSTIADPGDLTRMLSAVREQGFAVCDEEVDSGIYSIAVPLRAPGAGVLFSAGLVGPAKRVQEYDRTALVDQLLNAAGHLEAAVGLIFNDLAASQRYREADKNPVSPTPRQVIR